MSERQAYLGAEIFDGDKRHQHSALLVEKDRVVGIVNEDQISAGYDQIRLDGGLLAPGFIDLQVNGGGGILFNQQPNVDGIRRICAAHRPFGTTGLLPTLITDSKETTSRAIQAGIDAAREYVPGFLGLHLEGPHLDPSRKGAHDPALIREMGDDDLEELLQAAAALPSLMITIAPESVSNKQIAQLSDAGIIVSLGHTNTSYERAKSAVNSGARAVTHLFNAMSPLAHREPGLVGAALQNDNLFAGMIADGIHVHPAAISIALQAKANGAGRMFLITDAMATIGTDLSSFELNGRTITRHNGRLTLEDGTLAGADLDMISAVGYMVDEIGVSQLEALKLASVNPALCLGRSGELGCIKPGARASFIHLDDYSKLGKLWIDGAGIDIKMKLRLQPGS